MWHTPQGVQFNVQYRWVTFHVLELEHLHTFIPWSNVPFLSRWVLLPHIGIVHWCRIFPPPDARFTEQLYHWEVSQPPSLLEYSFRNRMRHPLIHILYTWNASIESQIDCINGFLNLTSYISRFQVTDKVMFSRSCILTVLFGNLYGWEKGKRAEWRKSWIGEYWIVRWLQGFARPGFHADLVSSIFAQQTLAKQSLNIPTTSSTRFSLF